MIMKIKHRHMLVAALGIDMANAENVRALLASIRAFVGVVAYALAAPSVVKVIKGFGNNVFIIRCTRGYENDIALALAFVSEVNGSGAGMCTLKTSGTIKSLERFAEDAHAIEKLCALAGKPPQQSTAK
ncbi:MAG: Rpp14/Pop5 family protein [Candidatus Micrarchaeia archaeon]